MKSNTTTSTCIVLLPMVTIVKIAIFLCCCILNLSINNVALVAAATVSSSSLDINHNITDFVVKYNNNNNVTSNSIQDSKRRTISRLRATTTTTTTTILSETETERNLVITVPITSTMNDTLNQNEINNIANTMNTLFDTKVMQSIEIQSSPANDNDDSTDDDSDSDDTTTTTTTAVDDQYTDDSTDDTTNTEATFYCNCPKCTIEQYTQLAGAIDVVDSTCQERIEWVLQNNDFYSNPIDACKLVSTEYPLTCGVHCNPDTCTSTSSSTSTTSDDDTTNIITPLTPPTQPTDPGDAGGSSSSRSNNNNDSKIDTTTIFGSNTWVIDSTKLSIDEIQGAMDDLYYRQVHNEMGIERYTVYFLPGIYGSETQPLYIKIGYYTQISGLGQYPTDVIFYGKIEVYNRCFVPDQYKVGKFVPFNGDSGLCFALNNFWRSLSNIAIRIVSLGQDECRSTALFWSISQASSLRRVHISGGNVALSDYCTRPGYASGGYISDSILQSKVIPAAQQQFFTRNSIVNEWSDAVWNTVFMGTTGIPTTSTNSNYPTIPITTFDTVPYVREIPFVYYNITEEEYYVYVPSFQSNTVGTSWEDKDLWNTGLSLSINEFLVVDNLSTTTIADINFVVQGADSTNVKKHILFLPNVYEIYESIYITRPNTIILGIGHATLTAMNGTTPIVISSLAEYDTSGVVIAGITIDAGLVQSRTLLQIGENPEDGSTTNDNNDPFNPVSLIDVYFRLGGPHIGKADISLEINRPNVIIDHTWIWRADHGIEEFDDTDGFSGDNVRWRTNTGRNGLVVNADDVTAYGLFVEHYQKHNVIWNGNNGKVYFFQCELPYDPPTQNDWIDDSGNNGYSGYKVSNTVQTHELHAGGVYCYNRNNPSIITSNGFESPSSSENNNIIMNRLMIRNLSGPGTITSIINNQGDAATIESPGPHYINY